MAEENGKEKANAAVHDNHHSNGWNPMGWLALLLIAAMIAGVATLVVLAINGNLDGGDGPTSLDAHNSVSIVNDKDCKCTPIPSSPAQTTAPASENAPGPAPIVIWNGSGGGSETGGSETTTVNSSSNSSSSVTVVVPPEPIAPQPPTNPTPIVVPPVNPTPAPQPPVVVTTPVPAPLGCRVIHDYQLQDLPEVATSGSHIRVEFWDDGTPGEKETYLPASAADGGRFILTRPLKGHVWEFADCTDEQMLADATATAQRRLDGHAVNMGYVQWQTTGLFQPS